MPTDSTNSDPSNDDLRDSVNSDANAESRAANELPGSAKQVAQPGVPRNQVSVAAKLNLLLVGVFGTIFGSCCVGSWLLGLFDETTEYQNETLATEVITSLPQVPLPKDFAFQKAIVKESPFGTVQVVEWETPGGSRFILGTLDSEFDSTADPSAVLKQLPVKNTFGVTYELLKTVIPTQSVEINGTVVQVRVVSINPQRQEGAIVAVFPTKENKTGIVYVKTNVDDATKLGEAQQLLEQIS